MKIDVLGTKYNLRRVNFDQDEFMRKISKKSWGLKGMPGTWMTAMPFTKTWTT